MKTDKIFFTSDNHYHHANFVHKYNIRDFSSVREMNETMIERWNETVPKDGLVYNLGDFSFGEVEETRDVIKRLNGQIIYIRGNHERNLRGFKDLFSAVYDLHHINVPYDGPGSYGGNITIALCHYPFRVSNKSHNGAWSLYGHDDPNILSMDVGVDTNDYYPYTFDDIVAHMETKEAFGKDFEYFKKLETYTIKP
jgi:calcineurin-like phosphoesterase family protein